MVQASNFSGTGAVTKHRVFYSSSLKSGRYGRFFSQPLSAGRLQELMIPSAMAMHTSSGNEPAPIFDMIRER